MNTSISADSKELRARLNRTQLGSGIETLNVGERNYWVNAQFPTEDCTRKLLKVKRILEGCQTSLGMSPRVDAKGLRLAIQEQEAVPAVQSPAPET